MIRRAVSQQISDLLEITPPQQEQSPCCFVQPARGLFAADRAGGLCVKISPTALIHDAGIALNRVGNEADFEYQSTVTEFAGDRLAIHCDFILAIDADCGNGSSVSVFCNPLA